MMNVEKYRVRLSKELFDAEVTTLEKSVRRVMLVAGARPNFVKLAPLYTELASRPERFDPVILHTGQHYDAKMSEVFFEELGIPRPHVYLGVGSGTHAEQTAKVMVEIEKELKKRTYDLVVTFGDVNSTLAAVLTACKMGVPTAHVEAGLRSFDRDMPEEINRIVADSLSDLLLTPSKDANQNLEREGIPREKIALVGNIMIDTLVRRLPEARKSEILSKLNLTPRKYALLTMHRPGNVDSEENVRGLIEIIEGISRDFTVVFPTHPRTRKNFLALGGRPARIMNGESPNIIITEPLGYLDFLKLQCESAVTLTDSGGVQEETTFLGAPCITLRPNTERPVTITHGTNNLIGLDARMAIELARKFLTTERAPQRAPELWDGKTAIRIVDIFEHFLFEGKHRKELVAVRAAAREDALVALME